MKIALHSVDGLHFPNLALMRISAWHKTHGDSVEWFMPLARYDRVYASKVFTFTPDDPYLPPDAIRGGTGYDVTSRLPLEIEETPPDYTIYPQFEEAYGFLTRGCVNRCPWCVVPRKEGAIRPVADIEQICNTNTGFRRDVVLMDNNFLAAPWDFVSEQFAKMKRLRVRIDFNQAIDARLITEDAARLCASVTWLKYIRISCDTDAMLERCIKAISMLRIAGYTKDIFVYVLAKNEEIDSALNRIYGLMDADAKAVPFVMPYRSLTDNSIVPTHELRRLARWCNKAWIRKSCKFKEYKG